MYNPNIYELVLIFVGDFNPVIINPQWLVKKGLIQENEGERAQIEIIHNEITRFSLDWGNLEINRSRFILRTTDESFFTVAKDLAISIFTILKETPVKSIGINHILHFQLKEDKYLELGKKLAPFENWYKILKDPRLFLLEMKEEPRQDKFEGLYRIRVAPSDKLKKFGVSININDHYTINNNERLGTKDLLGIVSEEWSGSKKRALNNTDQLWKNLNF